MGRYIAAGIGGVIMLFWLCFAPAAEAAELAVSGVPLSGLEQIEPFVSDGPEGMAALATISRNQALETLEKQRAGAKYFGGITYGHSNEPIVDTGSEKNSYNKLSLTGGLSFPLLGSLQKENVRKLETQTATMEAQHRSNMLALTNLAALRKAYTTLWIEQQKAAIGKRFLSTEAETVHILQQRQAQGLVLPTDKLEFLAVYYDVRRDLAASELRKMQALKVIEIITGRKWQLTENLKMPSIPSIDGQKIDLSSYPEVIFQNNLVAQYEKLLQEKKHIDRDANLVFGVTNAREFPGTTGNGIYIALNMTGPVKGSAKDQVELAAAEELTKAKQEEQLIRMRLDGQAEEALATAAYAAADVNAKTSHMIVMAEAIRERTLRRMVLAGDTFEQLQQSKSQYYRTALDMLNQEEVFLHSAIDIISYVYPRGLVAEPTERVCLINENNEKRSNLLAPSWLEAGNNKTAANTPLDFSTIPEIKVPNVAMEAGTIKPVSNVGEKIVVQSGTQNNTAIYVWNAEQFLQSKTRANALNEISNAGFSHMLISFTPKQLTTIGTPAGKAELEALLAMAKAKGMRVDLLLGDPTWAEAEYRGELLALIQKLQNFAFDGIHLDIEPDSLPGAAIRQPELLAGLADTVRAVKETTNKPVSIAIHPRYLEGKLGELSRQKLLPLGLETVVVMIYSDNPTMTAQRMAAIMAANPNAVFALAQSVEKSIPPSESYADSSQMEFKAAMQMLKDNLAAYGLKEIYIQAWEDYNKGAMP
ncbi:MAG: hypothetical protein H6Q72_1871 [Firmicutes bacterium]|nr:hypothetical protein [Bacillota bacterium]